MKTNFPKSNRRLKRGSVVTLALLTSYSVYLLHSSRSEQTDRQTDRQTHGRGSYVTLCQARLKGYHRTGNHLFMLSAVLDLAAKTGREVAMPRSGWYLDRVFDFGASKGPRQTLKINRYDNNDREGQICPCETIQTPHYGYDARFNQTAFVDERSVRNGSTASASALELCGLSQTFLHALDPTVAGVLRPAVELLRGGAYEKADRILSALKRLFLEDRLTPYGLYSYDRRSKAGSTPSIPLGSLADVGSGSFDAVTGASGETVGAGKGEEQQPPPMVVGVHARMGDFLSKSSAGYGLTVADGRYFARAFDFFARRAAGARVLFVVLSDDVEWATERFREYPDRNASASATATATATAPASNETASKNLTRFEAEDARVVFFADSEPQDFALLCRADGLIISTGTFGWWAAWFNGGAEVVYYEDYPRRGSSLAGRLDRKGYFMKHWIPMS